MPVTEKLKDAGITTAGGFFTLLIRATDIAPLQDGLDYLPGPALGRLKDPQLIAEKQAEWAAAADESMLSSAVLSTAAFEVTAKQEGELVSFRVESLEDIEDLLTIILSVKPKVIGWNVNRSLRRMAAMLIRAGKRKYLAFLCKSERFGLDTVDFSDIVFGESSTLKTPENVLAALGALSLKTAPDQEVIQLFA